jgi:hypothetical protein
VEQKTQRTAARPSRLNRPHTLRGRDVSFIDRRRGAGSSRPPDSANDRRRAADPT